MVKSGYSDHVTWEHLKATFFDHVTWVKISQLLPMTSPGACRSRTGIDGWWGEYRFKTKSLAAEFAPGIRPQNFC